MATDGLSASEMGLEVYDPETQATKAEIIRDLGDRIISNAEQNRFVHATSANNADSILQNGLWIGDETGFDGVANSLGRDPEISAQIIEKAHLQLPVAVLLSVPRLPEVDVKAQIREGQLPPGFKLETLFITKPIDTEDLPLYSKTESYLDPRLVQGFYDKDSRRWTDNPNYWEYQLQQQLAKGLISEASYQSQRSAELAKLKSQAQERLVTVSSRYRAEQESMADDYFKTVSEGKLDDPSRNIP